MSFVIAVPQEMLMDILRTLASPNIDIRKKTLDLALELVRFNSWA